jgi:predicted transcriptional regulator
MENQHEQEVQMSSEKVLASFEIDPKTLTKLKKLAAQHERSYSFILRKLTEQAIQAGTYQLIEPAQAVGGVGIKRGSKV